MNLRSVITACQFVADNQETGEDSTLWATGGGTPLGAQLAIAAAAQEQMARGGAEETVVLVRSLLGMEYEMMAQTFPFHLRSNLMRLLDTGETHRVFPVKAALLLWDENNTALPAEYAGVAALIASHAPYTLYHLPAGAAPAPLYPLLERPRYANDLRLLGHDALECSGNWRLHWTPGTPGEEGEYTHFFVHLLDGAGEILAQSDLRAYDEMDWRRGDHISTTFDLGQELSELPIATIRIGLYRYSDATESYQGGIYALDELGRPWDYAIDIPFTGGCVS